MRGSDDDPEDAFPEPFESWFRSYAGKAEGQPTREAMPEPFVGSWESPKLVTLGINPGAADLPFQGRGGYFTREVAERGYAAWARTDPYGSELWEAQSSVNRPRKDGRRVNPHRQARLRFAEAWLGHSPVPHELLMVELYPWHSARWRGRYDPPEQTLHEFIWAPLAELDVDVVFAFAARWNKLAAALGLDEVERWKRGQFEAPGRQAAAYQLPDSGPKLVVVSQGGYAGSPGSADTQRLREFLA